MMRPGPVGLMGLLALAIFVLRALIPVGYMPDPQGARHGVLRLIVCAAAGPATHALGSPAVAGHHGSAAGGAMVMAMDGANMDADSHATGGHHDPLLHGAQECPFAVAVAAAYLAPSAIAVASMLGLVTNAPPAVRPLSVAYPSAPRAPPLGSRAPPA